MKRKPLRALPLVMGLAFAAFISGAGSPVSAQVHEWTKMTPGANAPGVESLQRQCLRSRSDSGWSLADCSRLRQMAEAGSCKPFSVRDGQPYDALTGPGGSVSTQIIKRLGQATPAYVCIVAPGKVAHWYTGFAGACNNLGIASAPKQTFQQSRVIRRTAATVLSAPDAIFEIGGYCDPISVYVPGVKTYIPGSTIRSGEPWSN